MSTALNAVGGRVFPRKLHGPARACACGHVAAPDPPQAGCLFPPHCGVRIVYGGPGPRERSGAPGCFGSALPSSGHVVTPDPFLSGERVRDCWSGEMDPDPMGPAAQIFRA